MLILKKILYSYRNVSINSPKLSLIFTKSLFMVNFKLSIKQFLKSRKTGFKEKDRRLRWNIKSWKLNAGYIRFLFLAVYCKQKSQSFKQQIEMFKVNSTCKLQNWTEYHNNRDCLTFMKNKLVKLRQVASWLFVVIFSKQRANFRTELNIIIIEIAVLWQIFSVEINFDNSNPYVSSCIKLFW